MIPDMSTFGPSNYRQRPEEVRTHQQETAPGHHDGEEAIWDATALMREQAQRALERDELSPDAFWGAWIILRDSIGKIAKDDSSVKDWCIAHRGLLLDGIRRFACVPEEFIVAHGHPRLHGSPVFHAETMVGQVQEFFTDPPGKFSRTTDMWDTVSWMLKLVAEYEDGRAREAQ